MSGEGGFAGTEVVDPFSTKFFIEAKGADVSFGVEKTLAPAGQGDSIVRADVFDIFNLKLGVLG